MLQGGWADHGPQHIVEKGFVRIMSKISKEIETPVTGKTPAEVGELQTQGNARDMDGFGTLHKVSSQRSRRLPSLWITVAVVQKPERPVIRRWLLPDYVPGLCGGVP